MNVLFTEIVNTEQRWNDLCTLLDNGYWKSLAIQTNTTQTEIARMQDMVSLTSAFSPSREILSSWQYRPDATMLKFIQLLDRLNQKQAVKLIEQWTREYTIQFQHPISSPPMNVTPQLPQQQNEDENGKSFYITADI